MKIISQRYTVNESNFHNVDYLRNLNLLEILILLPIIGSLVLLFVNKKNYKLIRIISLWFSLITFFASVIL